MALIPAVFSGRALGQQLVDSPGSVSVVEVAADVADQVGPGEGLVGGHDYAGGGIERPRKALEGEEALPVVFALPPRRRVATVACSPDRNQPRGLVADVAVGVGVDHAQGRHVEERSRRPELLPAPRQDHPQHRVHVAGGLQGGPCQGSSVRVG